MYSLGKPFSAAEERLSLMELVDSIFNDTASGSNSVASDDETIHGRFLGRNVEEGGRCLILGSPLSRNLS